MARLKAFCYVVRQDLTRLLLLAFASLDEAGFEVPKGSVEVGETPALAALRELREEAGVICHDVAYELGVMWYRDEAQHGFLIAAPAGLPDRFAHTVTGAGVDEGYNYEFRWLEVGPALRRQLVQGCDRFVDALLQQLASQSSS